jgi:hypothetical protein
MKKNILSYLLIAFTVIGLLSMTSCKRNSPAEPTVTGPAGFYITLSGTANPSTVYISSVGADAYSDIVVRALHNTGAPASGYQVIFQDAGGVGYFEGFRITADRITDSSGNASMRYYIPGAANVNTTIMTNINVTLVDNNRLDNLLSEVNDVIPIKIIPYLTQGVTISGTILTPAGSGVEDIAVVLDGLNASDLDSVAVSRSDGSYEFFIPPGWSGTVTPQAGSYSFQPELYTFSGVVSSMAGVDFIASFESGNTLTADVTSWDVPIEGGTQVVNVRNATGDAAINYTVTPSAPWIRVSRTSGATPGSFTITVDENTTGSDRNGTVDIAATDIQSSSVTVTITQLSNDTHSDARLAADITTINAEFDGGAPVSINVYNSTTSDNIDFIITNSDSWFTVSKTSGTTVDNIIVIISANNGEARTGTITLTPTSTGVPNTVVITINQDAGPSIAVDLPTLTANGACCDTFEVVVYNPTTDDVLSWSASNSDAWITATPTSGTTNNAIMTIIIQTANPSTTNSRQGIIYLTAANGATATIEITQLPNN